MGPSMQSYGTAAKDGLDKNVPQVSIRAEKIDFYLQPST